MRMRIGMKALLTLGTVALAGAFAAGLQLVAGATMSPQVPYRAAYHASSDGLGIARDAVAASSDLDAATASELARFPGFALPGTEGCASDSDDGAQGVFVRSTPEEATHGLAVFDVFIVGGGGYKDVPGRDADGGSANVFASPDATATVVGTLAEGTAVGADEFVLTEAGARLSGGLIGKGFYHVNAPENGWVSSDFLSDAHLTGCGLRNYLWCTAQGPAVVACLQA